MKIEEHIVRLAQALGSTVTPEALSALGRYAELVSTWNARLDLTAAREPRALTEVLFADSLVMADTRFVPDGAMLLDVGSGAGAPAVGLALLRPDVRLVMIEPLQKRVAFLRTVIGTLDLAPRVRVEQARVDPDRPTGPPCDLSAARATLAPEIWLRVGLALAPATLLFATDSLPADPAARLAHQRAYALPSTSAPRILARFERS